MVMKNWQEHSEYNMLVNTPLVGYWFLWVGVVVCAVGVALVILGLRKKLLSDPSSAVVFSG